MSDDDMRCDNCHAPAYRLWPVNGHEACADCAELAASPIWVTIMEQKTEHPFANAQQGPHCGRCGAPKQHPNHGLTPVTTVTGPLAILGDH